jgi:hypothetical protein
MAGSKRCRRIRAENAETVDYRKQVSQRLVVFLGPTFAKQFYMLQLVRDRRDKTLDIGDLSNV